MKPRLIFLLISQVVLFSLITPCLAAQENSQKVFKWRMQTAWPPAYILQTTAKKFVDNVKRSTGGRLDIKLLPGGAVVSGMGLFKAVSEGVLEAGQSAFLYHAGIDPAFELMGVVPFYGDIYNILLWHYEGGGKGLIQELYAKWGLKGFAFGMVGPEIAAHSNVPMVKPGDFKGVTFRAGGLGGKILQEPEIGAKVIMVPVGEVYQALERGIIDACEVGGPGGNWPLGLHEVTKYIIMPAWLTPGGIVDFYVNEKAWNSLPDDIKAIVEAEVDRSLIHVFVTTEYAAGPAVKNYLKYGTKFQMMNPELQSQLRTATHRVLNNIASKNPFFAKVWESWKKYLDQQSPWREYQKFSYAE